MRPTPVRLAALARSSPWRWSGLRFRAARRGGGVAPGHVRAWVRRPDLLRVERVTGELLHAGREPGPTVAGLARGQARSLVPPTPGQPGAPLPVLDADGLVVTRPPHHALRYDAPLWQTYHWVAMLDPVELADGSAPWTASQPEPVRFDEVREVDHHGRPAWEALAVPTATYAPRCPCCPLLSSPPSEALLGDPLGEAADPDPQADVVAQPDAHLVRLDVGTGICVLTEQIGGAFAGDGHEVVLEAVDDELAALPDAWLLRRT